MSAVSEAIKATQARILTIDLERLPGLTPIFDQRVRGGFLSAAKWVRYPSTLCFAAKWYGNRTIEFRSVWDDPEALLQRSWELYDEADIVVTYNGRMADNRWLRDDWVTNGLQPPRPWKDVDLYRVNKSVFGFDSASLDHLCGRLGLPRKVDHYDPEAAERAANGDEKAQRRIKRYNRGDVIATEAAYDALRPWIRNHPNMGLYVPDDDPRCPNCGSDELVRDGTAKTPLTAYAQYRCGVCGTVVRNSSRQNNVTVRPVI